MYNILDTLGYPFFFRSSFLDRTGRLDCVLVIPFVPGFELECLDGKIHSFISK